MSELAISVGITGPRGFIASHLARQLAPRTNGPVYDTETRVVICPRADFLNQAALAKFVGECDTIVHLAGMTRGDEREIYDVNTALVDRLIEAFEATGRRPHVIFATGAQREQSNAYGRSKKYGEDRLREWTARVGAPLTILLIPSVFGPGCRPCYNSVVATFCHQLAHDQRPVVIDDEQLELVWINDVVDAIGQIVRARRSGIHEARVPALARLGVSELLAKLQTMRDYYFDEKMVPDLANQFDGNLYTTFLSHIEWDDCRRRPRIYADGRGELCELMRLAGGGQFFFSTTKPGVVRGNHFHSRKVELLCVVRGEAVIRIRRVGDDRVREFRVSGASPEFISIPALCTHQIENIGGEDLLTMFWCNEIFQPEDPDTFAEKVA